MSAKEGFYVETWGGGRYTSIAWYIDRLEAEKHVARLKMLGMWAGMPPRVAT